MVRPGGWVFAAAIPRLVRLAALSLAEDFPRPVPAGWVSLFERGDAPDWGRFPGGHFHTAAELAEELRLAGLLDVEVVAIEGPDGLALEQLPEVDEELHQAALRTVRALGHLPGFADLSNHMMGIGRVE